MKIKTVKVSYGVTVSYAKYRFVRVDYGFETDVEDGDATEETINGMREWLRKKVAKDARKEVLAWRKLGAQVEATEAPTFDFE